MERTAEEKFNSIPIRVLMANVPRTLSDMLSRHFACVPDILLAESPSHMEQIADLSRNGGVDVLLVGALRGDQSLAATKLLEAVRPRPHATKVLVLTQKPEYTETIAFFRAGANGIVCESELHFEVLCKSVRCVHRGEVWANNQLLNHLVTFLSRPQSREVTDARGRRLLSDREQQVLKLLSDGMTNGELACQLGLSEHTVKNHLFRIYDKLGVSNRMEAVLYALAPRAGQN